MRSVYIASALLLSVITLIICNSIYVLHRTDELLALCDDIDKSGSATEGIDELLSLWQNCRDPLSLSINHSEIDRAESALLSMRDYFMEGDTPNFRAQLSVFRNAVEHIAEIQRISFHNIF